MQDSHSLKEIVVDVSKTIGKVSARVVAPAKPKAVMALAHGAGAGMDHPFMKRLADELAALSIISLRYNFPFMENRKGRPDRPAIAEKTAEAALAKAHSLYPKLPVFASGKSFGGRMSSQKLSKECPEYVKGIIFYGFPLHPPGAPSIERAAHLSSVKIPMLFLQGTRDALADLTLLKKVCKGLPASTVITFEGADHSFKAGKDDLLPKLAAMTSEWIDGVLR